MQKLNCWEFKKCGRELGGINIFELGTCPASLDVTFDGVHDGTNAGRACWVVSGTMCEANVQGDFMDKCKVCGKCDFYEQVKQDEGKELIPTVILLNRLEDLI